VKGVYPLAIGLALALLPLTVFAHGTIKGLDDFYSGVLHPLRVPAHILCLIAIGLLSGQSPEDNGISALGCFGAGIIGLISSMFIPGFDLTAPLLIGALIAGLLIAAGSNVPKVVHLTLGCYVGLLTGLDSAQPTLDGFARFKTLAGTGLGFAICLGGCLSLMDNLGTRRWRHIGIRIVGSWIAASTLMVVTFEYYS